MEKLARAWDKDAEQIGGIRGDYAAGVSSTFQSAATQLRALLPLEVTDEGVNVPKAALAQVMAIVRLTYPVRPESLAAEAIRQCNAALTQPQTEKCPEDCDGFGQLIGDSDGPCPACSGLEPDRGGAAAEKCPNPDCEGGTRPNGEGGWDMCPDCLEAANADGGGAAVAAGARGADLEGDEPSETEAVARVKAVMKAGRDAGSGVFDSNSVFRFGTHGVAALLNFLERDGWEVIHTGVYAQPQKWIQAEAELEDQPTPYAEAFRERVCPVPEFPGIEKEES